MGNLGRRMRRLVKTAGLEKGHTTLDFIAAKFNVSAFPHWTPKKLAHFMTIPWSSSHHTQALAKISLGDKFPS